METYGKNSMLNAIVLANYGIIQCKERVSLLSMFDPYECIISLYLN